MRVRIVNKPGMLARVLSAIAELRGDPGAIDVVSASRDFKVRDITVAARAELLLAALAACMLKGIERVAPMLKFEFRSVEVRVHGIRKDFPPRLERIDYEIHVDTDQPDRRLELLHENVRKYGASS